MSDAPAEPVVSDHPERQRYEVRVGDEVAGYIHYERHGRAVDLIHTEIDPAFEGHGMGGVLARGALDDLRRRGLEAIPTCPFVAEFIRRHPAYVDLVVPDHRGEFTPS